MFEARELSVGAAVRLASFRVHRGETVVVAGEPGATAMLRAVAGLVLPTTGSMRLHGDDLTGVSPRVAAALGVAYVGPESVPYAELTVVENVVAGAAAGHVGTREGRADATLAALPRLAGIADRRAATLDPADAALLTIAMAIARRPRLLLVEAPAARLGDAYGDLVRALHLARLDDLVTVLAEPGDPRDDAAELDAAYVVRRSRLRPWPEPRA